MLGTLQFAADETSQILIVPLPAAVPGSAEQRFSLSLASPVGARLGTQAQASITIAADSTDRAQRVFLPFVRR